MEQNKIKLLQKKYENGEIKEKELSNVEKDDLLALYKEQIEFLEKNICKCNMELEERKKRIMRIRKANARKIEDKV